MLNLDRLATARVTQTPFRHFVAEGLLGPAELGAISRTSRTSAGPDCSPLAELKYGPAFARLIEDIRSPETAAIMSEKFDIDLTDKPLMITVRGRCQQKDGRIHTDTETKVVTALLYLNQEWAADGGRLRLLRGPSDLDDKVAEVPPNGGTLVAFRRSHNSYHGHVPFVGARRYVMFNWITSKKAARREIARHRLSAKLKRLLPAA